MRDEEHWVQDTLEIYAVAALQQLAEQTGRNISADSTTKYAAFETYARRRGFTVQDLSEGRWRQYKLNYDAHLPTFFTRLAAKFPTSQFDFVNTEVANRNAQRKGDFEIVRSDERSFSVSLKNYRKSALRPQVNSGTYNSFILGFLFESPGVGTFTDPSTGRSFRSTPPAVRDAVLVRNGYASIVESMTRMDDLNRSIRARFIDTDEFEFLNETIFDRARKECGEAGASLAVEILSHVDATRLKERALRMVGMDGAEEMLVMDPVAFADTITNPVFEMLRYSLQDPRCSVVLQRKGQGLALDFVLEAKTLLEVYVPFTINKNGAWISGDAYEGVRFHPKEKVELAYGQRRPRKSRELATSINTYVNFGATGIFGTVAAPDGGLFGEE